MVYVNGGIAQLGERTTEVHRESNRAVPGSIPGGANIFVFFDFLSNSEKTNHHKRKGV